MSADNGRVSVSLETLRSELGVLELRIVDRINSSLEKKADQAVMEQLELRISSLELSRASREHLTKEVTNYGERLTRLERFRYTVPGAASVAVILSIVSVLFHHIS